LRPPQLTATFERGPVLHVRSEVVGEGDGLEVYVLLDGRTVFYADRLTASVEATAFQADVAVPDAERWWPRGHGTARLYPVRVDLIKGGSLRHAWERCSASASW
jgi:beta-mannosidase